MIQTLWSLDQQFQNKNGSILTHGKIYVYYQGRTALANTYADEDGIALNTNPIILDNNGRAPCFVSTMYAYTVVVCDPYGNELFSYDITLHDVVDVAEKVLVLGTDGTVLVDTTTLPNGVQYDLSVNTDIIATNETVSGVSSVLDNKIDVVEGNVQSVCAALDNKKDKQATKSYRGSLTKTVTDITQDTNGVITVTYDDIDLPPEVPNVEIVSPNDTISVSATTDTSTNTKTFSIDVKKAGMQFFDGYMGKLHYEDRASYDHDSPIACYVDEWGEYKYEGDFITNNWKLNNNINFVLKPGLYLITASIRYDMHNEWSDPSNPNPSKSNNDGYIRIATGAYNGLENGTRYKDWSHEYQLGESTIQMSFVRNVMVDRDYSYMNNNNYLYFDPYLPFGVNYVQLEHLQIVKLDSVVGNSGGGSGTDYIFNSPLEVYDTNKVRLNYSTDTFTVDSLGRLQFVPGHALGKVDGLMSVLVNPASGIDIVDNQLVVKVGEGLSLDPVSGVIAINTEVGDVVETVEKLKQDLDTQITTNFDMPNISQVYDFADPSVSTLANGACMLCQSFTIPINHELRTTTDDPNTPTLFGIYSQQNFGHKIMLALYEYTYAAEGEEHGSSTYVGDTGPVNVAQGVNEYPLKNRNPSITELRSDKVYYATLYLPNDARVNGLMLAGAPNYGNQSIPAEPRLSCAVENITWDDQELDMNDPTTTLNHYQEVIIPGKPTYYQYYIGPWQSGYNERWTAPRFYMQIRNGEYNVPVVPTEPFNTLGDSKLPMGTANQSNIPSFQPSQANSAFRDVTPLLNVTITAFEWIDGMANAGGWAAANCVYDSGFANNLSGVSNTVTDLGQVVSGEYPGYAHRITFTTPITLTAGTTYRFLCGCTNGSPYFKVWLDPTDVIHIGNNGWYVVDTNVLRIDHQMGMYNKLYDNNNNHYVI